MSNKKVKNFFAYKKDIVSEKKKIKKLNIKKKKIKEELNQLLEMFDLPTAIKNKLPAFSFNSEYEPLFKQDSDLLPLFELRKKIIAEHQDKIDELEQVSIDINKSQLEIVLAKIKYMEKEIS